MEKQIVARTHSLCPICGSKTDEALLLSTRLRDISKFDNQATGFSDPCEECQAGIDAGAIMYIVIDRELTEDVDKIETWYRTGNIFGIKEEAVQRMLESSPELLESAMKKRAVLIDYRDAVAMGFPVTYKEFEKGEPKTETT